MRLTVGSSDATRWGQRTIPTEENTMSLEDLELHMREAFEAAWEHDAPGHFALALWLISIMSLSVTLVAI